MSLIVYYLCVLAEMQAITPLWLCGGLLSGSCTELPFYIIDINDYQLSTQSSSQSIAQISGITIAIVHLYD